MEPGQSDPFGAEHRKRTDTQGLHRGGATQDKKYVYFHSGAEATYREVSDRPSSVFTSIPTVDLAGLEDGTLEDRQRIARGIHDACAMCGFFYIKNHGVPDVVIRDTFALLRRFFALDHETKMEAHVQKNAAIRGYEPMLETNLDPRTKGGMHTLGGTRSSFSSRSPPIGPGLC